MPPNLVWFDINQSDHIRSVTLTDSCKKRSNLPLKKVKNKAVN